MSPLHTRLHRRLALAGTVVALVGVAAPATALAKHGDDDPVGHVRHSGLDDGVRASSGSTTSAGSSAASTAPSTGVTTHIRRSRGLDDGVGHIRRSRGADDGVGHIRRSRGADDRLVAGVGSSRSDAGDDRRGRGRGRGGDDAGRLGHR